MNRRRESRGQIGKNHEGDPRRSDKWAEGHPKIPDISFSRKRDKEEREQTAQGGKEEEAGRGGKSAKGAGKGEKLNVAKAKGVFFPDVFKSQSQGQGNAAANNEAPEGIAERKLWA